MHSPVPEAIGKARWQATLRLAARVTPPAARVLEIGSSDASFRNSVKHSEWRTVDKFGSPDIIADLDGPTARLPLPDRSVDVVFCTEVLEHLAAGSALVREIARVLVREGTAIISVPNMASAKARAYFARVPQLVDSRRVRQGRFRAQRGLIRGLGS